MKSSVGCHDAGDDLLYQRLSPIRAWSPGRKKERNSFKRRTGGVRNQARGLMDLAFQFEDMLDLLPILKNKLKKLYLGKEVLGYFMEEDKL
jgi:hypothetical protein